MSSASIWVFLTYRLPREPSTPRIAVWRKLKRMGVVQIVDGLVALPRDARNLEQLEWLAEEIIEAGGWASIWEARPTTAQQEQELIVSMQAAIAEEYDGLITEARLARGDATSGLRQLKRLRSELRRIQRRDYFPTDKRLEAQRAVEEVAVHMDVSG